MRGTDNDTKHPKCLIKCCYSDLRKAMKARIVETLERVGSPTLILDDVKVVDITKHTCSAHAADRDEDTPPHKNAKACLFGARARACSSPHGHWTVRAPARRRRALKPEPPHSKAERLYSDPSRGRGEAAAVIAAAVIAAARAGLPVNLRVTQPTDPLLMLSLMSMVIVMLLFSPSSSLCWTGT